MSTVIYLCDGKKPCATAGRCRLVDPEAGCCRRTSDPAHAVNGACGDPENHPERFERLQSSSGQWNGDWVERG